MGRLRPPEMTECGNLSQIDLMALDLHVEHSESPHAYSQAWPHPLKQTEE